MVHAARIIAVVRGSSSACELVVIVVVLVLAHIVVKLAFLRVGVMHLAVEFVTVLVVEHVVVELVQLRVGVLRVAVESSCSCRPP